RYFAVAGAMTITVLVYWLVLYRPDAVPPLFIEGQGLTTSKIVAAYVLAALYILAAVVLLRHIAHRKVEYLVLAAIVMAQSEICLTFYHQLDDLPNVVGHVYKIIGCMFLYYAIVVDGMQASYQQLRRSEQ